MSATVSTSPSRPRGRRALGVATAAGVLIAASLVALGPAAQAAGATPDPDNCRLVHYAPTTYVECVVTDSGAIAFEDLVPAGLLPHPGSSLIMTARGGAGATVVDARDGRAGGSGGTARTIAAADDIDVLHVSVGQDAATGSRQGGSATIVSDVAIGDVTAIDDTWLVAGGGGAQGSYMLCNKSGGSHRYNGAGSGGGGGYSDANRTPNGGAARGNGGDGGPGSTAGCPSNAIGRVGTGGDRGVAGINPGDRRSDGIDGVGGHGGTNGWQGGVAAGHERGRGGITGVYAMGGGGWGGGGGGERNGGGGGGGSWARAATEQTQLPRNYPSTPSVVLAWPLYPPAS